MSTTTPPRILIVGGGLAGPALAIALARSGIASTIFEIRCEPGNSGGALMLMPNALRVLDKVIGIYPDLQVVGFRFEQLGVYTEEGWDVGKIALGDVEKTGYPALRVLRTELHQTLLRVCGESELIGIQYGRRLERVEESEAGVVAHFEDGSSYSGTVLIGCDGIHSTVRRHVLRDAAPTPTFSGNVGIGGTLLKSQLSTPPTFSYPAFIYTRHGLVMAVPNDTLGERIGWSSQQPTYERSREGWKEYGQHDAARETRETYSYLPTQPIRSIMDHFDDASVRIWPPYEIPDLPTWHTKRVCLLGDAAHAIPPSGGQGSAQAFEDAGFMARLLSSPISVDKGYDRLFSHFERIRRARFEHIRSITASSGSTRSGSSSGFAWFVKKWAMWAYFRWIGGVLRDLRIIQYDVAEESLEF